MTRRALALTLALGLAVVACGKYGPPVRSAPREQPEASLDGSCQEPGSPETAAQERDDEEWEP